METGIVKKESPNKGRWFYTCRNQGEEDCGFFLWTEQADVLKNKTTGGGSPAGNAASNPGETGDLRGVNGATGNARLRYTALNNVRDTRADTPQSEAAFTITSGPAYSPTSSVFATPAPRNRIFRGLPQANVTDSSSDDLDDDGDSTIRHRSRLDRFGGVPTPTKRKRQEATIEISDLESDDAEALVGLADRSEKFSRMKQLYPSQPFQNSSQVSASSSTPQDYRAPHNGFGGLPTPKTGNSFSSSQPGVKRFRTAQDLARQTTPTPARSRNSFSTSQASEHYPDISADDGADITEKVLKILRPEGVSTETLRKVHDILELHATRVRGIKMGREMVREKLRASEKQIEDLKARVEDLETEKKVKREMLRFTASQLDALWKEEEKE
ncbi:hypothetical protein N0V88_006436 [Collariella sp. IMI 366227]|nr:hypothetical protein N0V88_006436 [Collariella sp. IMI 366227]